MMNKPFAHQLEARLLRYCSIDTQSDEKGGSTPSSVIQFDLLRPLRQELEELGASHVTLTDNGFVMATIPATVQGRSIPTVAFLAHVDTAPQFNATGVKPLVHRNYDGGAIALPDDTNQVLSPAVNPYLAEKKGDDLITASGTTLLGADDKAGVAIIMTMAEHFLHNPALPHGEIRICFTPDEEIGTGIRAIDLGLLNAQFAYTLDGGKLGEMTYETFSADKAVVKIIGVSIHPGYAKDQMVNALRLAARVIDALPQATRAPEVSDGRAGFIHPYSIEGGAAECKLSFILRDYEMDGLEAHAETLRQICAAVQSAEPRAKLEVDVTKQYRNMRYWLEHDMRPVELAATAMRRAGMDPVFAPVRGGTDGSQLTEMGVPTPNLFTGMQNIHGPLEWISVQDMVKATEVCIELAQLWAEGEPGAVKA